MTACTEHRRARVADGRDCEGQKGTAKGGTAVTACTEHRRAGVADGRDGEGQGIAKEAHL